MKANPIDIKTIYSDQVWPARCSNKWLISTLSVTYKLHIRPRQDQEPKEWIDAPCCEEEPLADVVLEEA